ncbi:MAG TPA: hypothetical protein H9902_07010 [Candidatus Stackebrandtia faecavium]|nr:hypothetical protein [Candidatus Stackebrandtia faecavium]
MARADAASPWIVDIPLTPDSDGMWTNKYLDGHIASVEDVTWVSETGISYLLPEIVLAYKARLPRDKDDPDFYATLPILTKPRRALKSALETLVHQSIIDWVISVIGQGQSSGR